jgi:hypothetical protein
MTADQEARRRAQVLIFDADDTLWENNIVFERVIDDFLAWIDHPTMEQAEIRAILDDIERANAVAHPKSDILPARAAGLNAVFIPNENTWVLEDDELDPTDNGVLRLAAFRDLLKHF